MASKSAQQEPEKAEVIQELLDLVDMTLDRVKVLYEQYFLGIQKQPPTHLHTDAERKLRELAQMQLRNTAQRYRLATLQQKFGSYNAYWRRTLRQIEKGTYHRNLSKIGRQVAKTGEEIPEEILAAMPKRMREQVRRDREAALALAKRRDQVVDDSELLTLAPEDDDDDPAAAFIKESTELRRNVLTAGGAHRVDEADADFDLDAFFASVTDEDMDKVADTTAPVRPGSATAVGRGAGGDPRLPRAAPPATPARTQPIGSVGRAAAAAPAIHPVGGPPTPPAARDPIGGHPTGPSPSAARPGGPAAGAPSGARPSAPGTPLAPSQVARPIPIMPGASAARPAVSVETMSGPFPREPAVAAPRAAEPARAAPQRPTPAPVRSSATPPAGPGATPSPRPASARRARTEPGVPTAPQRPPAGMTDADVNALYAKYVKAKEMIGEAAGPGAYSKLLKTINAQAPKIMDQYKAKAVDFQIVVKNNQVIIRAKPKP